MTEARIERVYADRATASDFLDQAEQFLRASALDPMESAPKSVLLHHAAISACDAILQSVGLRVGSGDRAHVVRLEAALDALPDDTDELFERLDASRERRNEASYAAGFVAKASVDEARDAVTELIQLAGAFIARPASSG